MQNFGDFKLPNFFNYPPYFTLQPVRDTREKQIQLWKELILEFCRSQKIFIIALEEDFPLFSNPTIEKLWVMLLGVGQKGVLLRNVAFDFATYQGTITYSLSFVSAGSLSHEAREAFLSALVAEGRAEWMDKGHKKCLVLWHRIQDWADIIVGFAKDNGLEDSVMTVEELRSGVESQGTELQGIDRTLLMRALKVLENKGKLAIFKGTSTDDDGVKFSV